MSTMSLDPTKPSMHRAWQDAAYALGEVRAELVVDQAELVPKTFALVGAGTEATALRVCEGWEDAREWCNLINATVANSPAACSMDGGTKDF